MPRPPAQLDAGGLYEKAVRALARRGRSEVELRRLLKPRAARADDVEAVLSRLREHGYLDDARLAQTVAGYQKEVLYHGRARAARDLRARGLAPEVADQAVAAAYAEDGGGAGGEDALLRAYVRKKRLRRPEDLRQAASLYRKLRTAGFSGGAAQRGLRAWKLNPEWLELIESSEDETP